MTAPLRFRGRPVAQLRRMCADKNRYPDELTARAAGQYYLTHFATSKLFVYKCPECAGFHLTRARHAPELAVDYDFSGKQLKT
jgi:hypothetical protein